MSTEIQTYIFKTDSGICVRIWTDKGPVETVVEDRRKAKQLLERVRAAVQTGVNVADVMEGSGSVAVQMRVYVPRNRRLDTAIPERLKHKRKGQDRAFLGKWIRQHRPGLYQVRVHIGPTLSDNWNLGYWSASSYRGDAGLALAEARRVAKKFDELWYSGCAGKTPWEVTQELQRMGYVGEGILPRWVKKAEGGYVATRKTAAGVVTVGPVDDPGECYEMMVEALRPASERPQETRAEERAEIAAGSEV